MPTGTYYHARIEFQIGEAPYQLHTLKLLTASEDGYELVATLPNLLEQQANQMAAEWRKNGMAILPFLLASNRRFEGEDQIWVQTQAPAGNWVYDTGVGFNSCIDGSEAKAIDLAKGIVEFNVEQGRNARLVRRYLSQIL